MENNSDIMQQYIVFKLDEQHYGLNIQYIQIIEKMTSIMIVPQGPPSVEGVMNLRGEIIPVVNLRKQFEMEEKPHGDKTRIIIVKNDEGMVGLIVDQVKEVVTITNDQIETVQNVQGKMKTSDILGVGKVNDQIVTLLNLEIIIQDAFVSDDAS